MTAAHWFLPEQPDVVGLLRAQLAITIEGLDAYVEWAGGSRSAAQRVTDAEARGDAAKRELLEELRAAFVLPLEPEDVFALSRSIDWILDLTCDLVAEAEVLDCRPDDGLAEMARILAGGARRLDGAVATLGDDGETTTARAEAAIQSERDLQAAYYRRMAALLEVEDRGKRIALRELYRRSSQIATVVVDVAERLMYAVIKQS
ncbi:MAG: DUF47 family protein [Solirubrobacterales bacterium]|nr:DUF47 family protein [Solirubrobacterales bacterium]